MPWLPGQRRLPQALPEAEHHKVGQKTWAMDGFERQGLKLVCFKGPNTNVMRTLDFYIGSYINGLGQVLPSKSFPEGLRADGVSGFRTLGSFRPRTGRDPKSWIRAPTERQAKSKKASPDSKDSTKDQGNLPSCFRDQALPATVPGSCGPGFMLPGG